YGLDRFLSRLAQIGLSLIRAQGCLILTHDTLTNGLYEEGCYFTSEGKEIDVRASDNTFVEAVRHLKGRSRAFVETDLLDARSGPLRKIEPLRPYLSCLVTPVSLYTGRESFLLLFSWSRDAFGRVDLAVLGLVEQILDVLAMAHLTASTVSYIQRN